MSRKRLALTGLFLVLTLVASACGGGGEGDPQQNVAQGGIFRIQTDSFEWSPSLDPTQEYLGFAFEFFNALHRPLLGYNHKSGAKGGNEVRPDLATDLGSVSANGLVWTFKLRKGVQFAPPISREVTSKDLVTAFLRVANPKFSAGGYPVYYNVIQGFKEAEAAFKAGQTPTSIAGIATPSADTIVFTLTKPTGDFRYRLTLAASAPMPDEVTKCMKENGQYGRFQVATGSYMIEGTDKLDVSSCANLLKTPISGFDPTKHLRIRRNTNYKASTDSKENRSNNIDGVDLTLNKNTDDIFRKIEQGLVDGESAQPPPGIIKKGDTDPAFKDNFHLDPGDRTWYLFFNMTKAPFDDINVRKAVSFVINKAELVKARGGKAAGIPAEHIVPPDVLGGQLQAGEFDPYASAGHAGDVAKAKEEMKKSKYDTNKDGSCAEHPACRNVIHGTRGTEPYKTMAPIIDNNLKQLGITVKTLGYENFYKTVQVPSNTPAIGSGAGWGKDYADASTFFEPLLSSDAITKDATQNFAFLGITADLAAQLKFTLPAGGVPSADVGIQKCAAALGDDRKKCWADLDKQIMTEMVPWVPYLWATNISVVSDAVVQYEYDQFAGEVSFVHIAIDKSKQKTA